MKTFFSYLLFTIVSINSLFAQKLKLSNNDPLSTSPLIKQYTQRDGLLTESLSGIQIGKDSLIYLSTFDGLVTFNGFHFKTYSINTDSSLQSDGFITLLSDSKSGVWALNDSYQLVHLVNGSIQIYGLQQGIRSSSINSFAYGKENKLWIATDYGISRELDNENFKTFNEDLKLISWTIQPIDDEHAWVMTQRGLFYSSNDELTLIIDENHDLFKNDRRAKFTLLHDGGVLVATRNGFMHVGKDLKILKIYLSNLNFYKFMPTQDINTFYAQTVANAFFYTIDSQELNPITDYPKLKGGFYNNHVTYWKNEFLYVGSSVIYHRGKLLFQTPDDVDITGIQVDVENNLWVTTNGRGLFRINYSKFKTLDENDGIPNFNAYSIALIDSSIWAGTISRGLLEWNGKDLIQVPFTGEKHGFTDIKSVYASKKGYLFTSTWNGELWIKKNQTWKKTTLNHPELNSLYNAIGTIYEDEENRYWIGTTTGLYLLDSLTSRVRAVKDSTNTNISKITVLYPYSKNRLLIGTNGDGAFFVNKKTLFTYGISTSKSGLFIRDIYSTHEDTVWFATKDKGLVRYVMSENSIETKSLVYNDIITDKSIHRILPDTFGYWWLTNNQGLYRINKKELDKFLNEEIEKTQIQRFTEEDGLPHREMNGGAINAGLIKSADEFIIPTQRGIALFNPKDFLESNSLSKIALKFETISSKSNFYQLDTIRSKELYFDEQEIDVSFSARSFSKPNTLDFYYSLDAKPHQKIRMNESIHLTQLESGWHTLTIKIAHQNSNEPIQDQVRFYVNSTYFESLFKWLLFSLLLVALLLLLQRIFRFPFFSQPSPVLSDTDSKEIAIQQSNLIMLNTLTKNIQQEAVLIQKPINSLQNLKDSLGFHGLQEPLFELIQIKNSLENYHKSMTSNSESKEETVETQSIIVEPNTIQSKTKRAHLLIVEDNEEFRFYLKQILSADYTLTISNSGVSALDEIELNKPDLIISDIYMPEMNGIEFAKIVFDKPGFENLPLIFLTATPNDEIIKDGLQTGAIAFLIKPVSKSVLLAQVTSLLKRSQQTPIVEDSISTKQTKSAFYNEVYALIYRHIGDSQLSIETIAKSLHMSKSTLYRKWTEDSEESINSLIIRLRLEETISLVIEKGYTFSEASFVCGFSNQSYFTRAFKKVYQCTPSEFIDKNKTN